ncbi:hypothetical protein Cni_G06366 [Canna indica]|uniref:Uncharacterized protein n=1 Tax=Canna indica TaxID=4628 RepID=A0AAQ3Q4P7_9LILI|nr:hypothetical protein Cni_G06366 [Canna indica]
MLLCANDSRLLLRTPSGTYPVATVDYADPHLVVTNPSMWSCHSSDVDGTVPPRRPSNPFSLDSSTCFSLSSTAARTSSSSSPSSPSASASRTIATPPATASATCAATCRIAPT